MTRTKENIKLPLKNKSKSCKDIQELFELLRFTVQVT